MRILIVEDDFVSRKLLHKLLSSYGEADIAVDGEEAVHAFEAALGAGQSYDLVVLDIMMPRLDGRAALKCIREIEERQSIKGLNRVKKIILGDINDE